VQPTSIIGYNANQVKEREGAVKSRVEPLAGPHYALAFRYTQIISKVDV
jgi:hypothetical protein